MLDGRRNYLSFADRISQLNKSRQEIIRPVQEHPREFVLMPSSLNLGAAGGAAPDRCGYFCAAMSIAKTTRIREGHELQLRLEVQNVPNAVHYDEPGSNRYSNGDLGVIDPLTVSEDGRGLSSDPRKMQFSARYTF